MERLLEAGALDVTLTPAQMKKNRPGVTLSVIARPEDQSAMRNLILTETSSLGVREQQMQRSVLPRDCIRVSTQFGETVVKVSHLPGGAHKYAPEFEDCRALARKAGRAVARSLCGRGGGGARGARGPRGHKHS